MLTTANPDWDYKFRLLRQHAMHVADTVRHGARDVIEVMDQHGFERTALVGVSLGAWIAAPLASEWIHHASLAIRAQIPLTVLREQVAQFPTYSEGYLVGLEQLARE